MFALIDCNNFYASCERLFRPNLHQALIVVLSNNDGCCIARSNEVKALRIAMEEPYFKIKGLCAQHGVKAFIDLSSLPAEGYSKPWAMRAELKSPAYTTCWTDVLQAHCGDGDQEA